MFSFLSFPFTNQAARFYGYCARVGRMHVDTNQPDCICKNQSIPVFQHTDKNIERSN